MGAGYSQWNHTHHDAKGQTERIEIKPTCQTRVDPAKQQL